MRRDIRLKKLRKQHRDDIAREADAASVRQTASLRFSAACDKTVQARSNLHRAKVERNQAYRNCWLVHETHVDAIDRLRETLRTEGNSMSLHERKNCAAELSRLQADIKQAIHRYELSEKILQNSQQGYDRAVNSMRMKERSFKRARLAHYRAQYRTTLSQTSQQQMLDEVFDEAGVPMQHRFKAELKHKEGHLHVFFGNPRRHGHYVISDPGKVTYGRNPGEPHGAHNFRT